MAQRTIHYLFGELLSREYKCKNKNRFLLGSILPDAYTEVSARDVTHFTDRTLQKNCVCFNFSKFRTQYEDLIKADDLYLGYYMHLVEDNFYRQFIRQIDLQDMLPTRLEKVARLHRDYHLLNTYIVEKYRIKYDITIPEDFEKESITDITDFALERFLKELQYDFIEKPEGKTYYLTELLLDEFMDKYILSAKKELNSVLNGEYYLKTVDFAW